MKGKLTRIKITHLSLIVLITGCSLLSKGQSPLTIPDQPAILEIKNLKTIKKKIHNGDSLYTALYDSLLDKADSMLNTHKLSVIYQPNIAEESSIHDYNSLSPYYWPNPDTPDGLPYIKKDGETNPETKKYDSSALSDFYNHIKTLSLAGYFSDNQLYHDQAIELLQIWFLGRETYMNPNFKYAQTKPGITQGATSGLIQARHIAELTDFIVLISISQELEKEVEHNLIKWYKEFNSWLESSQLGRNFKNRENNLGTYHDVIYLYINQFIQNQADINKLLEETTKDRIQQQINSEGYQVNETRRSISFHYSVFNLKALTILASYGDKIGINLWSVNKYLNSSILDAAELLLDKVNEPQAWSHNQIRPIQKCRLFSPIVRIANSKVDSSFDNKVNSFIENNKIKCASIDYFTLPPLS